MMQYDRLYTDHKPQDDADDPTIAGPIGRADNSEIRFIEYCGTQSVANGTPLTFTPVQSPVIGPPDFWVLYIDPEDGASRITLQEEGQDVLTFQFMAGSVAGTCGSPERLKLPGRSRQITLTLITTTTTRFVLAAIWGYDPKDIF